MGKKNPVGFDMTDDGGIEGIATIVRIKDPDSPLLGINVIIITKDMADLHKAFKKLTNIGHTFDKNKCTAVIYKKVKDLPEETGPIYEPPMFSGGYVDEKGGIGMYVGPTPNLNVLLGGFPTKHKPAYLYQHYQGKSDAIYRWHYGKEVWVRVNKDVEIVVSTSEPIPKDEYEDPPFNPDDDIPF